MKTSHKPLVFSLSVLLLASAFCQTLQAQTSAAEDARIARLAGLARVWGTVKYFHPYLAYRDVDWDKALVETIPKVNAAKSPQDYQAALNQMLAVLNDKSTRAEIVTETKPAGPTAPVDAAKLIRTENGVLIIDAGQIAKAVANDTSALNKLIANINESLPNAASVIFDARSATKASDIEVFYLDTFMRQALTGMLDKTVVLGATRYRVHNGYATQVGGGANFYYSGLINSAPQTIAGRSKTKTPPIVFIVNQNSPSFTDILSGMQAAGALIVQEGEQPTSDTFTMDLPEAVKVRMRTFELVNPDGSIELQPDVTVAKSASDDTAFKEAIRAIQEKRVGQRQNRAPAPALGQVAQKDQPYAEMVFPNSEYRLLALFRYWNVINYFFPYKHLIGDSWETVLPRYIPKFEANKDAVDYQLTVRELVTEMHDSHGGVRNANAASEKFGTHLPPVLMGYIENKSVVTKVLNDKLPIKVGDVVLTIDGEPVEKKREFLARYTAASTPQWLMRSVNGRLLLGPKDSVVKLKVQSAGGEARDVELPRSESIMDPKWFQLLERSTPVMQVLPSGVGYADLDRLQVGEVDKMFETIKQTPAVIFDMRGYPNGTAWSIAPRLTEKKNVVAALFSRPILEATSLSDSESAGSTRYSFAQKIPERQGDVYKGKVVVLINEDAISQAEHTCMFFEAATDVTFIGMPTAGANGDVTVMVLPGNLTVSFSGHDVRHADGRQLQRLGIQPTLKVAPTIRGLVEGRDEILEAAINFLKSSLSKK
jgi:C-terminal processing protease CtpA/Prc